MPVAAPPPAPSSAHAESKSAATASAAVSLGITARAESVSDKATEDDALGFGPYTQAIAEFLLNARTEPPLTLSIEGDWGRGKSSFMLQLEGALHRVAKTRGGRATVQVARFSAWQHEKDEALWASFALSFLEQIAPRNALSAAWRKIWLTWKRFNLRRGWLDALKLLATILLWGLIIWLTVRTICFPTLLPDNLPDPLTPPKNVRDQIEGWWQYLRWIFPVALSQPIIKFARGAIKGPLQFELRKYIESPSYREKVPFVQTFHEDFARLVDVYVGREGRAFVFVDDLDRCEVPKAAELLQALNMMIPESSRLVFVLGIDRKKVAAGIAARYEKLLPFVAAPDAASSSKLPYDATRALEYGYEFLEKFVQLPFRLPRVTGEGIEPLLDRLLEGKKKAAGSAAAVPSRDLVESDGPEVREAMKMVAAALDFNPRRMKHFLNLFRLRHYIAEATGKLRRGAEGESLTLPRLAKLVAIELRWLAFIDDAGAFPTLLGRVEAAGTDVSAGTSPEEDGLVRRWKNRVELVRLLQWGVADESRFRLTQGDIEALTGMGGGGADGGRAVSVEGGRAAA